MRSLRKLLYTTLLMGTLFVGVSCEDLAFGDKFLQKPPSSDVTIDTIFSTSEYARRILWKSYQYLPYGMQKALDLIPLVGSSTDIFRTNTFRIFGKLIWSPYLIIIIPVLIGILCMPFAIKSWSRRMKA